MARAAARHESRLGVTMMTAPDENPLTSSPDVDAALARMIDGDTPSPLTPVQAYAQAFGEIDAHEGANMAGMRAALSGVLACFDPAAIEVCVGSPTLMERLFGGRRKARLWDRMVARNAQLADDAEEDFQRLFAQAFGWKYDQARTPT
jgi:type VI secretion system FHA domain protein